jgi:hypothetical protein
MIALPQGRIGPALPDRCAFAHVHLIVMHREADLARVKIPVKTRRDASDLNQVLNQAEPCRRQKTTFCGLEPAAAVRVNGWASEQRAMLIERGLRVMHLAAVSEAHAIAWNYLRKAGAIYDAPAASDRLAEIVMDLFNHGELNTIRLANKAIARFQAAH